MDNRNDGPAASVEDAARRVREAADSVASDVKNAAMQGVESARAKAGDKAQSTSTRLRDLAGGMDDLPWIASAFHMSADGIDSLTTSLTKGDMSQCMSGVSEFARRQPAIFLGASVALGFALSRVGKTALEHARPAPAPTPEATAVPYGEVEGAYRPASEG